MLSVEELVDRLIDLSFAEDIGDGDHTTLCCIPEDAMGKSHLLIKEDGILAGVEIAKSRICSSRRTVSWLVWRSPRKCSAVLILRCRWRC